MTTLPSATTTIVDTPGAQATGTDRVVIIAPVATSADSVAREYGNAEAINTQHGYSEGFEYAALHIQDTGKPVMFVGIPIATAGVVSRQNGSGNTGSSVVSAAAGGDGTLGEAEGVVTVVTGGTIGTDLITIGVSMDGGRSTKNVRIGTANSYVIPFYAVTLSFAAGTLVAGDTAFTFSTSAPVGDVTGWALALAALANQQKNARSWMFIGDMTAAADATGMITQLNAYKTADDRFVYGRSQTRDRLPLATKSREQVSMTGNPNITFAEVGGTGDTITRSAGSFVTDGFTAGQIITYVSPLNDATTAVAIVTVTATVITLDTDDLVDEGPIADVTITGTATITFAEVGGTGDTITRSAGSWLVDGFAAGDDFTITGTASNNITTTAGIVTVTATVITLDTDDLAAELIGSFDMTMVAGETKAQHVSAMDSLFVSIADEIRMDIGFGRARKLSPVTFWSPRRPAAWAASIREYQSELHIPVWRKSDGTLSGWDLADTTGTLVEHDERVDGGAIAAGFTCMRTWSNGPSGAFMAQSLTRAVITSLLSRTHNMSVVNVASATAQAATENAVGQVLVLNDDGTATSDSLALIKARVDSALDTALLRDFGGEGPRASKAVWNPATDDILNVVDATLNGTLELLINGTLEHIATNVNIVT